MDFTEEYILSQYEERGTLNGNERVRIVRNSITGMIAVKKLMGIEQKPVYDFLKNHRSPFIPEIYENVEKGQQLVVIEEYIEGRNLEDILYDRELSEEEACSIVCSLCRALEPLHMAQPAIVCRDLKPENVMLTSQNHVVLVDFDIARVVSPGKTRDTVVMGTEGFAAPEQFGHRQTDGRSDIYAIGTVLNYCILRKLPVEKMVDGELGNIVRKCIAVNPDERYQNVAELRNEIEKIYPPDTRDGRDSKRQQECSGIWRHAKKQKTGRKGQWRRFLPPGFRSGTIWKMVLAVIGYVFLADISFSLEVKESDTVITGGKALLQQILFFLSQLAEIAIIFNYMGCRDQMSFLKIVDRKRRIKIYIALEFALITISVVIWVFLCRVFW